MPPPDDADEDEEFNVETVEALIDAGGTVVGADDGERLVEGPNSL